MNNHYEVLVVKGWLSGHDEWSLPGGGIKRGETPAQGLVREVAEEVGFQINTSQVKLVINESIKSKGFKFNLYIFTGEIKGRPEPQVHSKEILTAKWVDYKSLNPKNSEPDVLLALEAQKAL